MIKKYFHFFIKSLSFLLLLILSDFIIGSTLKNLYFKQSSGLLYRTTYAIDSTRADMLIFGSSTANHHYNPAIFENKLNISCYNTGRDGNSVFYSYAILKGVLKRYHPKIVILDLSTRAFKFRQDSYDRIAALLPYYDSHPELDSIIQLKSPFEKYKLLSKIYPFNSLIFTIAAANTDSYSNREYSNDERGFIPLKNNWKGKIAIDSTKINYNLDSTKIKIFESFLKDCTKANVQLYICVSPYFKIYKYKDPSLLVAQELALKYHVNFLDFSSDSTFLKDPSVFFDESHLNMKGSNIFSNKVVNEIVREKSIKNSE